jgi:hypothetical protein
MRRSGVKAPSPLMEVAMHYLPHGYLIILGGTCLAAVMTSPLFW